MKTITAKTTAGTHRIFVPESWDEVTVAQYQRLVKEWDGKDWIKLFSILADQQYDSIAQSTDHRLEGILYKTIEFVVANQVDFEKLKVPDHLVFEGQKITIPKKIGRLSIGQNIQAKTSLQGLGDLKEGISIVTAIYLQPLIDNKPFDHLRAIEIEQQILQMPITKIFPIGFFLLKRMTKRGSLLTKLLNQLKQMITRITKTSRK